MRSDREAAQSFVSPAVIQQRSNPVGANRHAASDRLLSERDDRQPSERDSAVEDVLLPKQSEPGIHYESRARRVIWKDLTKTTLREERPDQRRIFARDSFPIRLLSGFRRFAASSQKAGSD